MAFETAFFDIPYQRIPLPAPPPKIPAPPAAPPLPGYNLTSESVYFPIGTNSTDTYLCRPSIKIFGTEYMLFRYTVDVYVLPFVMTFGIMGNIMSFVVLGDMKQVASTAVLRALAIVDSAYLVNCLFFQTLETLNTYDDSFANIFWFFAYIKARVVWPLANTVQTIGVWLIVLVTAERYYAISNPLNAKTALTRRRNRLWILLICVSASLFNSPCHFELRVLEIPADICLDLRPLEAMAVPLITDYYYNLFYKTITCLLFRSVGPVLLLSLLNVKLIREIHKSKSGLNTNQTRTKSSNHMTQIVAVVVGTFIICQIPDATFRILRTVKTYNRSFIVDWVHFAYLATVSNMFVTVNSAINFLLYCVSGQKFRHLLVKRFKILTNQIRVRSQSQSISIGVKTSTSTTPPISV